MKDYVYMSPLAQTTTNSEWLLIYLYSAFLKIHVTEELHRVGLKKDLFYYTHSSCCYVWGYVNTISPKLQSMKKYCTEVV